jgi:hypothetical protein
LISPSESDDAKWTILNESYAIPPANLAFLDALKRASLTSNLHLKRRVQAEQLYRNDASDLSAVSDLLLTNGVTGIEKDRLLYSIANGITTDKAIPQLDKLLRSGDPSLRLAAAEALWHTGSRNAIPPLTRALGDSVSKVRYYAIRGLADATGQLEWGPSIPEFEQNGPRYLQHWLDWANGLQP